MLCSEITRTFWIYSLSLYVFLSYSTVCEMHIREVERDNRILREENKTLKQELTLAHQKEEECQRQLSSVFSAYTALQQHLKAVREKANVCSCLSR